MSFSILTQCIYINIIVIYNQYKNINEIVYIVFHIASLKSGVYFTLTAHLNSY